MMKLKCGKSEYIILCFYLKTPRENIQMLVLSNTSILPRKFLNAFTNKCYYFYINNRRRFWEIQWYSGIRRALCFWVIIIESLESFLNLDFLSVIFPLYSIGSSHVWIKFPAEIRFPIVYGTLAEWGKKIISPNLKNEKKTKVVRVEGARLDEGHLAVVRTESTLHNSG